MSTRKFGRRIRWMQNIIISMIIILLLFAGIIWLQLFLSKKKNKWLGLIIPLICFAFSIMAVFGLTMFTNIGISTVTEIDINNGNVITDESTSSQLEKPSIVSMIVPIIPVFLILNIPTIIFLAIYLACREKLKLRTELDKMNIQDLE